MCLKEIRTILFTILIISHNFSIRDIAKATKIPKSTVHDSLYRYLNFSQQVHTRKFLQSHATNNKPDDMNKDIQDTINAINRVTVDIKNEERSKNNERENGNSHS